MGIEVGIGVGENGEARTPNYPLCLGNTFLTPSLTEETFSERAKGGTSKGIMSAL